MKRISPVRSRRLAAAAFLVAGSARNHAVSANPHPRSSRALQQVQVAAVDITQSFRRHPGLRQAMDELKDCRAILASQVIAARRALREASQRLATLEPGSEAHRLVEAKIARREAQLRQRIEEVKGEFRRQEARICDATYDALVDTMARYTKVHETALVHRSEPFHAPAQSN
ncbi:MAG: hypothetical protein GXY83_40350 [Rhodopirellula sp.]|nr:hypothetical protein [Rhodopirellula sp.]